MADQYFVNRNGKIFGPFTSEAVKLALSTNKLTFDDLFCTSKEGPWKKLKRPSEAAEPVRQRRSAHEDAEDDFDSFGLSSYGTEAEADHFSEDYPPLPPRKRRREKTDDEDSPFSSFKKEAGAPPSEIDNVRVGSPWQRFQAWFVDALTSFLFMFPGIILLIFALQMAAPRERDMPILGICAFGLIGIGSIALVICQLYLQINRAQSIGKWFCKLQIFDVETMRPAGFFKNWFLRSFVNNLIASIPIVGGLYAIVDICFVFSENHQCLHDQLAGTQVMDISSVN